LKYRSKKEIDYWKRRDPLVSINKFLLKKRINKLQVNKINLEVKSKIKKAFIFAENSKFPDSNDYKLHVFKK
jgi:TPP-dependent pyruvate/acetoin dehydrogenase alpha subunit